MYSCEFLVGGARDCGAEAGRAVSVRAWLSDGWQRWPVCQQHEDALAQELVRLFVVSAAYPVADRRARAECERLADIAAAREAS